MRTLLLLCALAVVALAEHHGDHHDDHDDDCDCSGGKRAGLRSHILNARINKLSHAIDDVNGKIDKTIEKAMKHVRKIKGLDSAVDKLAGNGCHKGEFQCGDDQCISDLMVCDGAKECENGADESEFTCKERVPAGTVLTGKIKVGHAECTRRKPTKFEVFINSARKVNYFSSRMRLGGYINLHFHDGDSDTVDRLDFHGYYNFANRLLAIEPPEDDGLGITCQFWPHTYDHCHAHIVHEASLEPCADFVLYKD